METNDNAAADTLLFMQSEKINQFSNATVTESERVFMAEKEIAVSVICVTYNHEKYIRQALDSILMQKTEFNFEVLIGEDCSTDGTRAILKEYEADYPDVFRMYYRDENIGATKNEYELFMNAKGKYIAALELDDIWTDELKLQKQFTFMEAHPEYIGVSHNFDIIDKDGHVIENDDNQRIKQFFHKKFTFADFMEYGFVFQTGTHFYRNIYNDGQDYTIIYKAHTLIRDLTILSILLNRGDFYILPDTMSAYRRFFDTDAQNGRNVTVQNLAQDYCNTIRQVKMLYHYFDKKVDFSQKWNVLLTDYFKGMLKRVQPGFSWGTFLKLYFGSSPETKKKFRAGLMRSLVRRRRK